MNVIKEIRSLRFIINSLLTKRQRFLIPFFKQNMIAFSASDCKENNDKDQENQDLLLMNYVKKTIDKAPFNKGDQRIL